MEGFFSISSCSMEAQRRAIIGQSGTTPLHLYFAGWPERATGATSSSHSYCGTGTGVAVGREFAETHLRSCLHAGLRVSGEFADRWRASEANLDLLECFLSTPSL